MTTEKASTLSQHLRDEANRFFVYPEPAKYTTRSLKIRREVREMLNEVFEKSLEQFLMFGLNAQSQKTWQKWQEVNLLDDLFCHILLRDIPQMVQRTQMVQQTLAQNHLVLRESQTEFWNYLRESARCLILGLSQASVALARAAMEACLRDVYTKITGHKAYTVRQTQLNTIISYLSKLYKLSKGAKGLSEEEEKNAFQVKTIADRVLHDTLVEEAEALKVFTMARSVIQSMTVKHAFREG